ncbi:MAG: hypothetical protein K0S09_3208 [Sphingobacteriaceae bacterium]|jgi:long-chain acyl-CoA synthetase|nr:hypothetical protein [Sphingobacteriaceae bacterium]
MLTKHFTQPSEKIFLTTKRNTFTYGWLMENMRKTTGLFNSLNLKKDDRIILSTTSEAEISVIFLTALNHGIGVIVVDNDTKTPRTKAIIDIVSPKLIIADANLIQNWELQGSTNCKILSLQGQVEGIESYNELLSKSEGTEIQPNYYKDSLAYIMFTSGTTSEPKGVAISQENLFTHLQTLQKVYHLDSESLLLNQLILSHADGLIQGPVLSAVTGCTWHRPFGFSIDTVGELLQYIYANDITHFFAVPTMLHFLVSNSEGNENCFQNPNFKLLISVSANLTGSLWDACESTFNVQMSNVYGLTETVAGGIFCVPLDDNYKKYTVGKPVDCDIKIVDLDDKPVKQGESGHLCMRGSHIMRGYWKNQEKTDEVIKEGWLYSGDRAIEDENGYITIVGRIKSEIISGGMNIQPQEITECVLYNEKVFDAFAFGLPDEILGEKLAVAIVPPKGETVTREEIISYCNQKLEKKLVPQEVYILDQLPKGISGKVQIEKLKEICRNLESDANKNSETKQVDILSIISEIYLKPVSELSLDADFFDLGGDSMLAALFIAKVEQVYNVKLQFRQIYKTSNLQDLQNVIIDMQNKDISELEAERIRPQVYRLSEGDQQTKIIIAANDYYEIHELANHLTDTYDCYFVQYPITFKYQDNKNKGLNEKPTIEGISTEIIDLLNRNNLIDETTIFMGFSFGGLIAYEIARVLNQSAEIKHKAILVDAIVSDLRFPLLTQAMIKVRRKIDTISSRFEPKKAPVLNAKLNLTPFVKNHSSFKKEYMWLAKKIEDAYIPKPVDEGLVVLITSEKNEAKYQNISYWKERVKCGLLVIEAKGNHRMCLLDPELSKWVFKLTHLLKVLTGSEMKKAA